MEERGEGNVRMGTDSSGAITSRGVPRNTRKVKEQTLPQSPCREHGPANTLVPIPGSDL